LPFIESFRSVAMIYALIACLGMALFLGARYLARTVQLTEPRLVRLQPIIPVICFGAMVMGIGIIVSAAVASAWSVGG
jgi:hypothetical protein